MRAAYTKPYIAHASIGPSCAIARWKGDKLEVWTHSQGIFGLRQDLSKVLGMNEDDIVVTHVEGAGCYGHNGADDVALDAALLARGSASGRPVRLQWMRDDEFAWEPYGAAMAFELEAGLDAHGPHRLLAPRALEQRPHPPPGPRHAADADRRGAPRQAVRALARR